MRIFPALLLVLSAILGCESGTAFSVELEAASDTVGTPEAPILLRAGVDERANDQWVTATVGVFCGDLATSATKWYHDDGFGCLAHQLEGDEVPGRTWLQPAPAEWDMRALCHHLPDDRGVIDLSDLVVPVDEDSGEEGETAEEADTSEGGDTADTADTADSASVVDTGLDADGLPVEPDAAWPIADGTLTWRRDGSPCGGIAEGTIGFPR